MGHPLMQELLARHGRDYRPPRSWPVREVLAGLGVRVSQEMRHVAELFVSRLEHTNPEDRRAKLVPEEAVAHLVSLLLLVKARDLQRDSQKLNALIYRVRRLTRVR